MSRHDAINSKDSGNWLDFKDPKKVAYGLGAVAATIGVGILTAKGGKKIFIAYADRRTRAKGLISMGVLEERGSALSAAREEGVLDDEKEVGRDLFSMDQEEGFAYPLEDSEASSKYLRTAKKLWELVKDHLPAAETDAAQDWVRAEKE